MKGLSAKARIALGLVGLMVSLVLVAAMLVICEMIFMSPL